MNREAKTFLENWHAYIASPSQTALDALIADNASISSPAYWKPKQSKPYVMAILTAVTEAFEDFHYTKEWVDGREMILEFTSRVGDVDLKGIDRITINDKSQIEHIEVMIRPLNGLMALAEHVKSALAAAPA